MADGRILDAVAQAEQIRRRRVLTRLLLRVVPAVAGGLLVAAALVKLAHLPLAVFWSLLVIALVGIVVVAWFGGRVPSVTDAAAAQLDADAALQGELRSAHWFASHPNADAWAAYHLAKAADRVDGVSWPTVYPPVKTARVWSASAIVALAAIALVLSSAWPAARRAAGADAAGVRVSGRAMAALPADLQKRIDDLITAIQKGTMPLDEARAKISALRDELSRLDPKLQAAMAKAAQAAQGQKPGATDAKTTDAEAAKLASRAEKAAAEKDLPQDMKWSMEDLAAKLAKASQNQPPAGAEGDQKSQDAKNSKDSAAQQSQAGQQAAEAGVQMTRSTAADSESSQMMATTASPMGAEARGAEADAASKNQLGAPLDLAAMRKETVQADADSQGTNVLAEMRRKSEQSHSTLSFTRVAPLAAYDKSHAAAPPPPPESLRALVRQYFIRR